MRSQSLKTIGYGLATAIVAFLFVAGGDAPRVFLFPLLVAVVAVASWALRPPSRRLGAILPPARDDGRGASLSNAAT